MIMKIFSCFSFKGEALNLNYSVKLKELILQAKTVNQLSEIIINYTHEEIIQVYGQLTSEQQRKIQLIWKNLSLPLL